MCTRICASMLFVAAATMAKGQGEMNAVALQRSDERSFELVTGEYRITYAPFDHSRREGWVVITRTGREGASIGTKFAQGQHLDVTNAGDERLYRWALPRKDSDMFRTLTCVDGADAVAIAIETERVWAYFTSRLVAYKEQPGLVRWTVTAKAKRDKAFDHPAAPDCHFLGNDNEPEGRAVVRYMIQRGPASGIAYFRDPAMDSLVFYLEDFSSLNDLYRLTGCANPYEAYSVEGNPGAVKMGAASSEFQFASKDGENVQPWKPFEHKAETYESFGYERPRNYRIPEGTELVMADTYLYLRPAGDSDNVSVCKAFVEMLADVYEHTYKPPVIKTDWADEVVPRLCADVMRPENSSVDDNGMFYPRAYVHHRHADKQLWTLNQLLTPLTAYVGKYPEQAEAVKLKELLEKSMPLYYDEEYKGFLNNLPPINPNSYYHTVYLFNPAMVMADLATLGNADAKRLILGFRDRLVEMGRSYGYVFADVNLGDYTKQRFYYQFDGTCAYMYVMMRIYQLSGNQDKEALESAKSAAERLEGRCLDLMWQINQTASGTIACEWLYEATGDAKYRELAYIPLANTLRWAWLWECNYGVGENTTTFWSYCGTPACPTSAEYETHQTRHMMKQYAEAADAHLTPTIKQLVNDGWRAGLTQARFTLPPYIVEAGAAKYLVAEGPLETDCGEVRYDQMIPLEDVRGGWGTDTEWYHNNGRLGMVGQEIYGAGGPIWYALWQDEL